MSYYDEIDPTQVMDARAALLCARLNLRGARRLLRKGSFSRGISALYDSVLFGMNYYITRHDDCATLDLVDATGLFQALARTGIFDDHHAFNRLSLSVERALWQGSVSSDAEAILRDVEEMLTKLGVVPFNKNNPPQAM
jgi:hypothetical protein